MEGANIEAEIAELSKQIEEKRRALEEARGISVESREAISEVIRDHVSLDKSPKVSPTTSQTVVPPSGGTTVTGKSYLDTLSPEAVTEVNRLIELVGSKGVKAAISQARSASPFILDAFHDALVDKLYDEMKSRGYIK